MTGGSPSTSTGPGPGPGPGRPGTGRSGLGRPNRRFGLVSAAMVVLVVPVVLVVLVATRQDDKADSLPAEGPTTTAAEAAGPTSGPPEGGASSAPTNGEPEEQTTTTAKPAQGPKSITLAFAGDLLPHMPVNNMAEQYGAESGKPFDYAPMLAPMAPALGGADLAICHMEVPLAPPGERVTSYPSFGAPAELVDGARSAGYDGCSTASNHSLDRGQAGLATLLDRFDQQGLQHAGTARTAEEGDGRATRYDVKGVPVAHLSYAYGFNGYPIPSDAPWSVNEISADKIKADAARARAGGAELVVVSLHWGTEYDSDPSQYQRDVAGMLVPSPDIDIVIGHHAHVVQPIEEVGGTYVVFGLGNQLSNMEQAPRRDGLTVVVEAERHGDRWTVSGIEAVPTWVDLATFRVLPVVATMADPATSANLRNELSGSYDRTVAIVTGSATPGVTVAPKPPS